MRGYSEPVLAGTYSNALVPANLMSLFVWILIYWKFSEIKMSNRRIRHFFCVVGGIYVVKQRRRKKCMV